jgi:hypothetical protein
MFQKDRGSIQATADTTRSRDQFERGNSCHVQRPGILLLFALRVKEK